MRAQWRPRAVMAAILAAVAAIRHAMGRVAICACGDAKPRKGEVWSAGTSQHPSAWSTLSHLAHGVVLCAVLRWLRPRASLPWRAAAALPRRGREGGDREHAHGHRPLPGGERLAREVSASLDCRGDFVLNSFGDGVAMLAGFLLAARLPVAASVAAVIGMEGLAAWMIRDDLALNVLMLLRPLEAVRQWQMQGAPPSVGPPP